MYKRRYSAHIVIASKGEGNPDTVVTPYGPMRSRDGAELKYTSNDANGLYSHWEKHSKMPKELKVLLIDPTLNQLEAEIRKVSKLLTDYPQGQTGIDLAFFGHGRPKTGDLVLRGGDLSARRFLELQAEDINLDLEQYRGVALFLDSCYSGSFLASLLYEVYVRSPRGFLVFDALLSSYPDETSWELSWLEHGVFTYTFLVRGNQHVPKGELQKAIDRKDQRAIAKHIQGLVASMADASSYLTQGRQHSVDITSGHAFFEFTPEDTVETLNDKVIALRRYE